MKSSLEFPDVIGSTVAGAGFGSVRKRSETFRKEVCEVYDLLISKGMEQNLAIRRTRAILKANDYPFITYDGVMTRLRASGRFKKYPDR